MILHVSLPIHEHVHMLAGCRLCDTCCCFLGRSYSEKCLERLCRSCLVLTTLPHIQLPGRENPSVPGSYLGSRIHCLKTHASRRLSLASLLCAKLRFIRDRIAIKLFCVIETRTASQELLQEVSLNHLVWNFSCIYVGSSTGTSCISMAGS